MIEVVFWLLVFALAAYGVYQKYMRSHEEENRERELIDAIARAGSEQFEVDKGRMEKIEKEFKRQIMVKDIRMENLCSMLAVLNTEGLSPTERIVLFDLKFGLHTGLDVTIEEIAKRVYLVRNTVKSSIGSLEKKGFLKVHREKGKGNLYEVLK